MNKDELVPLKAVLQEVGVSRATLWRALNSNIAGMPRPTTVRRRIYWLKRQIAALDAALDAYQGRGAFEQRQTRKKLSASARKAKLLELKKPKRKRESTAPSEARQRDLFGGH
jgi:predicted DNA-binding transcriptional regulator AlpA